MPSSLASWFASHTPEEAEALRKLIASQRWDDETDRVRHRSMVQESQLGTADEPFTLDSLPDRRSRRLTGLVGLGRVWTAAQCRPSQMPGFLRNLLS